MVVHVFKSQTLRGNGREVPEAKASLGSTEKSCLKNKQSLKKLNTQLQYLQLCNSSKN